jgi:hypothetical protein
MPEPDYWSEKVSVRHHRGPRHGNSVLAVAVAIVVVVTVLAGVLTHGRLWGKPTSSPQASTGIANSGRREVGAGVVLLGATAPTKLHAVVAAGVRPPFKLADPVSQAFNISPSGPLLAPLTIELPLDRKVPADGLTLVFTSESPKGPWTPLQTTVTPDGRHAQVRVTHLSYFDSLRIDIDGALEELKQSFNGLTSGMFAEAQPPKCSGEAKARQDGYLLTALGTDSIAWCLGIHNGRRVLKAVNNRRYPLLALHPGLSVVSGGSGDTFAQRIARWLSAEGTVIYPRDEAVFGVNVPRGAKADLEVSVGQQAQLLSSLDVGVRAMLAIVTKFGAGTHPNLAVKVVDTLLTADECRVSKTTAEMIANCLNAKQIIEGFGPVLGLILAPIITVSGIVDYFHGAINGLLDQFSDRSWAKVVVQRLANPPFTQFVGDWQVHGMQMTIKPDRTGVVQWNAGPCLDPFTSPPPPWCSGHASIRFTPSTNGVIGTYTRVWFTTWAGDNPPAGFDPGTDNGAGYMFELRRVAPGLLKVKNLRMHIQDGNPYWCGAGVSTSNRRLCGA